MTEKINAILMLEILGKPADYVKQTLKEIVDKLGKENNVKMINKTIAEPKKLKEKDIEEDIFTSFAEVEIETSLETLMLVIFGYMPSHIDIVTPEELKIKNADLNMFFNELTRRLHQYDELAKALMIERDIIARQIKEGKIKLPGTGDTKERKNKARKKKKSGKNS